MLPSEVKKNRLPLSDELVHVWCEINKNLENYSNKIRRIQSVFFFGSTNFVYTKMV